MHWKLKAAAFRLLELSPLGGRLHLLAQRHLTRSWPRPSRALASLVESTSEALRIFSSHSDISLGKARFLEIGAGRDLAMPVAMRLLGVEHVTTVDVRRLAKLDLVNHAGGVIADQLGMELAPFSSWDAIKEFGIDYRAPYDIALDPFLGPVDAFVSNSVLEHIPPQALQALLSASRQFLSKNGLSIHVIDYSDHYARNSSISKFNFLVFDDDEWRPFNSSFQYVNRLRHSEYLAMHLRAGLEIIDTETYSEDVPSHVSDNLADRFRSFEMNDLKTLYSRIVSRRT